MRRSTVLRNAFTRACGAGSVALLAALCSVASKPAQADDTAADLRALDTKVLADDAAQAQKQAMSQDIERRRLAAIARENAAWAKVKTREDWEKFRDARLAALKRSLGDFSHPPKDLKPQVTGRIEGDGFVIEKLVFESRPGLLVTANLYASSAEIVGGFWFG